MALFKKTLAVSANWWEAGGATGAVAVWQGKGAASKAASLINLANPGTYDLSENGSVTWASADGWSGFNSVGSIHLYTGSVISGTVARTVIVRATLGLNVGTAGIIDLNDGTGSGGSYSINAECGLRVVSGYIVYGGISQYTNYVYAASHGASETLGDVAFYRDGTLLTTPISYGTLTQTIDTLAEGVHIGKDTGASTAYFDGYILAVAIYDNKLTADQVAAVSTAMAAL